MVELCTVDGALMRPRVRRPGFSFGRAASRRSLHTGSSSLHLLHPVPALPGWLTGFPIPSGPKLPSGLSFLLLCPARCCLTGRCTVSPALAGLTGAFPFPAAFAIPRHQQAQSSWSSLVTHGTHTSRPNKSTENSSLSCPHLPQKSHFAEHLRT